MTSVNKSTKVNPMLERTLIRRPKQERKQRWKWLADVQSNNIIPSGAHRLSFLKGMKFKPILIVYIYKNNKRNSQVAVFIIVEKEYKFKNKSLQENRSIVTYHFTNKYMGLPYCRRMDKVYTT